MNIGLSGTHPAGSHLFLKRALMCSKNNSGVPYIRIRHIRVEKKEIR